MKEGAPAADAHDPLREVADAVPIPLCVTRREDGLFLLANRAFARGAGFDPQEDSTRSASDFYTEFPPRSELIERLERDGQVRDTVLLGVDAHGHDRWVSVSIHPIAFEGEDALLTTIFDLTPQKRAETLAIEKARQAELLLEVSPDGVAVVDAEGRIQQVNSMFETLFDYTRTELVGSSIESLIPLHTRERHKELRTRYQDHPTTRPMGAGLDLRGLRKDGTEFPLDVSLSAVDLGEGPVTIASVRDLTERRRQRAILERSQERLESAQRVAGMGHWDWNIRTNELHWSGEIYRIFGLEPDEFAATYDAFLEAVHPDDRARVQRSVEDALHRNIPYSIDHRIVQPGGATRHVHEQADVSRDPDGTPTRMLGIVMDITERKGLEERLSQAQKTEALGLLAAGVAHDFNNVLTAIVGRIQLLTLRDSVDRAMREQLLEVARSADRASALTAQLLSFSQKQVTEPQPTDLNDSIRGMHSIMVSLLGEDIEIVLELAEELDAVVIDPSQMDQILVNLATNARAAMPAGGTVTFRTERAATESDFPYGTVLRVTDTGEGMDEETLARAFEAFFTTKSDSLGSGIGLATVRGIVNGAGGHISVESVPGQGATFTLHLPGTQSSARKRTTREGSRPYHGSETVLIIEDDATILGLMLEGLRSFGYQVLAANGPDEAARIVDARQAPIHVIVSDVVMPGMSGPEIVRQLRPELPEAKAIFTSGYAGDRMTMHSVTAEGSGFLPKPFGPIELARELRRVLDE